MVRNKPNSIQLKQFLEIVAHERPPFQFPVVIPGKPAVSQRFTITPAGVTHEFIYDTPLKGSKSLSAVVDIQPSTDSNAEKKRLLSRGRA